MLLPAFVKLRFLACSLALLGHMAAASTNNFVLPHLHKDQVSYPMITLSYWIYEEISAVTGIFLLLAGIVAG